MTDAGRPIGYSVGLAEDRPLLHRCARRVLGPRAWPDEPLDDWLVDAAAATRAPVVDSHALLCPGGTCHAVVRGLIAYIDDNHLSATFTLSLADWFVRELRPLVG
ncbi:MAG: SGNH hydrolase domain-containing protein [Microbacterium sp.]